jgi:hypothetical protein
VFAGLRISLEHLVRQVEKVAGVAQRLVQHLAAFAGLCELVCLAQGTAECLGGS